MKVFECKSKEPRKDACQELKTLKLLDSPFTMKMQSAFRTSIKLCLILDII